PAARAAPFPGDGTHRGGLCRARGAPLAAATQPRSARARRAPARAVRTEPRMKRALRSLAGLASFIALVACKGHEQNAPGASLNPLTSAAPSASAAPPVDFGRLERTRDAQAASKALERTLTAPERRLAARALTRSGGRDNAERIVELL